MAVGGIIIFEKLLFTVIVVTSLFSDIEEPCVSNSPSPLTHDTIFNDALSTKLSKSSTRESNPQKMGKIRGDLNPVPDKVTRHVGLDACRVPPKNV